MNITVGKRPSEEELAGRNFDPDAQPGDNSTPAPSGTVEKSLGVQVTALTPQIAGQLGADAGTTGVVVMAVDPNSDAARKGLSRGDIVMSVNYNAITSVAQFETAIRDAKASNREAVLLRVKSRGRPAVYVPVRIR